MALAPQVSRKVQKFAKAILIVERLQPLFSSGIDVLVFRGAAFSIFVPSKGARNADNSISYADGEVWPARCNAIGRNTESQLL